jgi:hypothetical protein
MQWLSSLASILPGTVVLEQVAVLDGKQGQGVWAHVVCNHADVLCSSTQLRLGVEAECNASVPHVHGRSHL